MNISGPYMNQKQAAEYCGYKPRTFHSKLQDYELPRYGPERNKFSQSVLDAWMQNPDNFLRGSKRTYKHKPKPVKV